MSGALPAFRMDSKVDRAIELETFDRCFVVHGSPFLVSYPQILSLVLLEDVQLQNVNVFFGCLDPLLFGPVRDFGILFTTESAIASVGDRHWLRWELRLLLQKCVERVP